MSLIYVGLLSTLIIVCGGSVIELRSTTPAADSQVNLENRFSDFHCTGNQQMQRGRCIMVMKHIPAEQNDYNAQINRLFSNNRRQPKNLIRKNKTEITAVPTFLNLDQH